MGSKRRHAKELLALILTPETKVYVEPFLGGANMMDQVPSTIRRIGSDVNRYLIGLFQALQKGWTPPEEVSEALYGRCADFIRNKNYDARDDAGRLVREQPELLAFVGLCCSFGAKWYGGYARDGRGTNYALESRATLARQAELLAGVELSYGDYRELPIPSGATVYCDPPYAGTTEYTIKGSSGAGWSPQRFWDWAEDRVLDGCSVFVSEYKADDRYPGAWDCVWEKEIGSSLTGGDGSCGKKEIERLFKRTPESIKIQRQTEADPFQDGFFAKPLPVFPATAPPPVAPPVARLSFEDMYKLKQGKGKR